jgi:hypothetical protein
MQRLALVLLAGLAACAPSETDPRGVRGKEVLLQVSATGRAEVRPDEARFTVGVTSNAPTAAAASTENNRTMTRVTEALERLGVKADDVQTRSLTLSRIDYGPERGRFRADNLVEVKMGNLKRVGEAVAAATEAGGNVVSGPDLRISSPEAADNPAYAAAYKAARARADTYAAAAGLRVKRVLAIRDGSIAEVPIPYAYGGATVEATAASAPPPTAPMMARTAPPVRAGVTTREVTTRVDFALAK